MGRKKPSTISSFSSDEYEETVGRKDCREEGATVGRKGRRVPWDVPAEEYWARRGGGRVEGRVLG